MTYFDLPAPEHQCPPRPAPTVFARGKGWRCSCGRAWRQVEVIERDRSTLEPSFSWQRAPELDGPPT